MIDRIEHKGILLQDCPLPGERHSDDRHPGHANGTQLSRTRFLIIYTTRGWRGTDDNCSVVYQIRRDAYDGPVLREGFLARSMNDWDPLGDGHTRVKGHLHPTVFGVPKGALIDARPVANANVFVAKWWTHARFLDPKSGLLASYQVEPTATEWVQFRLNEAEDDIETIRAQGPLEQTGPSSASSDLMKSSRMTPPYVQAVPLNADATEWVDCNEFDGRIAAVKYRYNVTQGIYERVETGSPMGRSLIEGGIARWNGEWVVCARSTDRAARGAIVWARVTDPFQSPSEMHYTTEPACFNTPITLYACADGVLRLLTGDKRLSPWGKSRDPLFIWDVDPDRNFSLSNRRQILNGDATGLSPSPLVGRVLDQAKILPATGGRSQIVLHRIRPIATNDPRKTGQAVAPSAKATAGVYYAILHYREPVAGAWTFADAAQGCGTT